jgi:hypothetical protein
LDRIKNIVGQLVIMIRLVTELNIYPKETKRYLRNSSKIKNRSIRYDGSGLVDDSEKMDMYKEDYGKSIITCCKTWWLGSWYYLLIKETFLKQKGRIQFGGVIYSDSADKATRFITNCSKRKYLGLSSRCYQIYGWKQIRTWR